jgi:glycosyltransferase involved in cell wall biosynthesis
VTAVPAPKRRLMPPRWSAPVEVRETDVRAVAVTIAIPTRDRGALLARAIRSALAQVTVPVEVIVVDDGSIIPAVVDPDPRVSLVRFQSSRGVCAARNEALALARGRWIAFLDDDDELASDFAERAILAAERSQLPGPVAVLAGIEVVDANGRRYETRPPITMARGTSFFAADASRPRFQFANSLLAPTDVVREIGGWDERFRAWEVEDFLLRLTRAASLQGIEDLTYRIHDHRGVRLGSDYDAMLDGARLTLHAHRRALAHDRERRAKYYGAMAFLEMQHNHPVAALGLGLRSFVLVPRVPRRPDDWVRAAGDALTRPWQHRESASRRTRHGSPSARLGRRHPTTTDGMSDAPDPSTAQRTQPAATPRLSIGLVVYNGERYLAAAIDSLLDQTFRDYELIISDNGSTDGTPDIVDAAAARDSRIRSLRHPRNRGLAWNLNVVVRQATGEFFMWAGHDDLHDPEFVERCIAALEADPEVVYAYGDTFLIDDEGRVFGHEVNRFRLKERSANRRFWEQLVVRGGQNFYGIIRTSVLRSIAPHGSIPWAERVMFAELALHGRFALVPDATFYWRRHPGQLTAIWGSRRAFTDALDPGRPRWRRSTPMLIAEYVLGYAAAIARAPLGVGEKLRCYARLARWLMSHVRGLELRDPRTTGAEITAVGHVDQDSAGGRREDDPPDA